MDRLRSSPTQTADAAPWSGRPPISALRSPPSWPDLIRPSTRTQVDVAFAWMAGTEPGHDEAAHSSSDDVLVHTYHTTIDTLDTCNAGV